VSASIPPPGYMPQPSAQGLGGIRPAADAAPESTRRRSPHRARLPILVAGLVIAIGAAIGATLVGSSGSPIDSAVAQAATTSSSTAGYRMSIRVAVSSPALAAPVTLDGDGVVDLRHHATDLALSADLSQIPQAAQQLGTGTLRLDMIVSGSQIYMKLPQVLLNAAAPVLGDKPWLKVNLSGLPGVPGASSLWNNPTMSDPSHILDYLRASADSVTNEGQENVNGVPTTHYLAALSLSRLPDSLPPADRAAVQKGLSGLAQAMHGEDLPMEVWIDAHHLVRRIVMSINATGASEASMRETMTADFSHYGPQTQPQIPSADQVQDLTSVAAHASGLGGDSSTPGA
jgi:hypothetical protein